jgi:sugar phosphate isomerase/epimerase
MNQFRKGASVNLSMTTDYVSYTGDPLQYIRKIARAGFSHIHWCHEWCTDHLYGDEEVALIRNEITALGIQLLDLHAPHGKGAGWGSSKDDEKEASLVLLGNRIEMTGALGGGAIILHLPRRPSDPGELDSWRVNLRRSLDGLRPQARGAGVRIALENMPDDDFIEIGMLFCEYDSDFLGLCYDSGHGNMGRNGLDNLARWRNRLISVHLHDNDGSSDEHGLPFGGTVNWQKLADLMAASTYDGFVSLESNMRGMDIPEEQYLGDAFSAASALAVMIEGSEGNLNAPELF